MGCLVVSEACCWLALTSVWNILGRRNCERDGHGGLQPFTSFLISWYFQQAVEIRRATKSTNFRIPFFWLKMTPLDLKIPSLQILMEIKLVLSRRVSCAPVSTPFGFSVHDKSRQSDLFPIRVWAHWAMTTIELHKLHKSPSCNPRWNITFCPIFQIDCTHGVCCMSSSL